MEPVDPFWNLVIQASTALVAGAALILSVMNYRREKRRDEVRVHVGLRTNQIRKAGDPTDYADSLTAEVTNTGQRPTTLQAIALVFARRRLWRWGIGKTYVWSKSHSMRTPGGVPLAEGKPQEAGWRWEAVERRLRGAGLDNSVAFIGVRARVAGERIFDFVPRYRTELEKVAREVMAETRPVLRRAK